MKNISFLNEVSPIEADFSKKNLEYDIQISALKKKLSAINLKSFVISFIKDHIILYHGQTSPLSTFKFSSEEY